MRGVGRILDANLNRAKEGLRVCEEVARFVLNSRALTSGLKQARHDIDAAVRGLKGFRHAIRERRSISDVGRGIYGNELKRKGLSDVFFANLQRVKESIRVLEEFGKLDNPACAIFFKRIRYRVYEIEKKAAARVSSLSGRR